MRRNRRIIVGCSLLCLIASGSFAQVWSGTAGIEIQVTGKSGPVTGARVLLRYREAPTGSLAVLTDPRGRAAVVNLAPGAWNVEVSHPEYLSYVSAVTLETGKKATETTSFLQATGPGRQSIRVKYLKATGPIGTPTEAPQPPPRPAEPIPTPTAPPAAPPEPEPEKPELREPDIPAPTRDAAPEPRRESVPRPDPETTELEPAELDLPTTPPPSTPPAAAETPKTVPEPAPGPDLEPVPDTAPAPAPEPVKIEPTRIEPPPSPPAAAPPPTPSTSKPPVEADPPTGEPEPVPGRTPAGKRPATQLGPPESPPPSTPPVVQDAPTVAPEPAEPPELEAPVPAAPVLEPRPEMKAPQPEPSVEIEAPQPEAEIEAPQPEAEIEIETEAAPEVAAPPTPAAPREPISSLRAFQDRSCAECKPGEWSAASVEVAAPMGDGGACPADAVERAGSAARLIARAPRGSLTGFAGPAIGGVSPTALELMPADRRAETGGALSWTRPSCRVLAISVPRDARFTGFRYEAADERGQADCVGDQDCPIGDSRFLGNPGIERGTEVTVIYSVFENSSVDHQRRARLTAYFVPASGWKP